ncbi:MAG TPA: glycosyltransferase family 4 protein [Bryobacteraceae bacterium]|nr:glycosyltransferase family 4 protein [Bryobacteraceae bacterium]
MRSLLRSFIGADRPRIIAVIATNRGDLEAGLAHARTANSDLPIKSWCACDGATALSIHREFSDFWPALTIVAWTGGSGHLALKLLPFTAPPFRILIFNEARGFFPARPHLVAAHLHWRVRDLNRNVAHRLAAWIYSLLFRAGERIRDVCRLMYSLLFRSAEKVRDVLELLYSIALAQLAVIARCSPWLVYRIFASVAQTSAEAPPRPATRAPQSARFTVVPMSGRVWPARRAHAALGEEADFIVFRASADPDPRPLIDIARATGAFAVAWQNGYTGWRRQLLNKHPFRRLQPGEVCQVFAPWSSTIVIRRDLLAEIGLPFAFTTGAAFMILFWKAAAAGWKSFVVGRAGSVSQEPAMPLEDAEFVARLSLSQGLREMVPVGYAESRGVIAFSPRHARTMRTRRRVLVVSPYLPFPLAHGGAVRIYNLCRALSREIDFILCCFHEAGELIHYPELHQVFHEVYAVDIDEKDFDSSVPTQVAEYRSSAMRALIGRVCDERAVDVLQLEYTQMAEYRDCAPGIPVILVEHDVTFTLYDQLGDAQAPLWRDFERRAFQRVDAVLTMSEHDRAVVQAHGAPPLKSAVVPNGVDVDRFRPQSRITRGPNVLFVGSFRHLPNLLAFEFLREALMPLVWREVPECRLTVIAGPDHERAAALAGKAHLLAEHSRLTLHGFVEDVRPAYRECDVVAVPLPVSAGTNIKVIEAMACGRVVVSTPVGCVGLGLTDGREIMIREIGVEFAQALVRLLRDSTRRDEIAARARSTAELRFDWNAIARDALMSIVSVSRRPSRAASA